MFGIEFWAVTFDFVGKILIGVTALLVHRRVRVERRIDRVVLRALRREKFLGVLGIILIVLGYALHLMLL